MKVTIEKKHCNAQKKIKESKQGVSHSIEDEAGSVPWHVYARCEEQRALPAYEIPPACSAPQKLDT